MDGMKDKLHAELRDVKLSDQRKKQMLRAVRKSGQNRTRPGKWQYRTVLVSFVILALSFTYISVVNTNTGNLAVNSAVASQETTFNIMTLVQSDSVKLVIMIFLFTIAYLILLRDIKVKKRSLPVCSNCGEEWTRRQSLAKPFSNKKTCPYCNETQYLTRETNKHMLKLNFLLVFTLIIAQIFADTFLGILVYLLLVMILYNLTIPYYMELQSKNPDTEPFW
ncbi:MULTISPECIES: TIGR04104 family putative zinc finger protein [unclassified Sporosarcina]|uniref:TIGR04104 family putative zinc finger protein n=1 Tax=unclassified Sporosarcina TaxID=2647733 RepID=UPI00204034AF|nr:MULTISPECIES: TIGR04104 family putative zinc finger protein [unclassified Sporosarcina]GKV66963.1 hypothetical protein NCCP2331_31160 [Sporosarcina sp. NCCP-2331]GLB57280.1 hypothetical protein NCCP2378_30680 [Sporosarcina sp. NCCP-2378]